MTEDTGTMESSPLDHRHPCDNFTRAVNKCHRKYGKQGEECVREELSQKHCYAQLLCRNEARRFYDEKSVPQSRNMGVKWKTFLHTTNESINHTNVQSKVSCANLVEVFAKPENELLIPEGITKDDRVYCRKIVHELATCLSKKRKGINTSI